jgi:phosphoribosylformimino-5-aminoimidazole carboxamide ribotide isomerase
MTMREIGIRYALYTDVQRDGMLTGVDVVGTTQVAQATGLRVTASGGFSSLSDLEMLLSVGDASIEGVIIGQALYTGAVLLQDALAMAREQSDGQKTIAG